MPYTLVKFVLWALLLAVIGGVIGWLLRSLTCRAEMARLRATGGDPAELERLRARSVEFDEVTAERDRLRMEIADVRGSSAGTLGFAHTADPDTLAAVSAAEAKPTREPYTTAPVVDENRTVVPAPNDSERSAGLATLTPAGTDTGIGDDSDDQADAVNTDTRDGDTSGGDDSGPPRLSLVGTSDISAPVALDLAAARAALGRPVKLDDLTVVEGIGPKIAELCAAIGIDTWRSLADVDVATLQSMLGDAGARFKMHKPDSWPEQAGLLAAGRWDDFVELTDRLVGGV